MAQTKIKAGGFDADVITGTTALTAIPADTDEIIISDAGTLKRMDYSVMSQGHVKAWAHFNAASSPSLTDSFGVSSIVPEAVIGEKDKTKSEAKVVSDASGNVIAIGIEEADWTKGKTDGIYDSNTTWDATKTVPVYQGIDQAKLVPLLVKTIQELETRIKTLEDA